MMMSVVFFIKLLHLLCFFAAWGVTVWVFTIGYIMLLVLPRHLLGNLRTKMFPVYFHVMIVCCSGLLATFLYMHSWLPSMTMSNGIDQHQLGYLLSSLLLNLASLHFFTPMTVQVVKERHKVERELSIGEEVGWWKNQKFAKLSSKLAAMNQRFRVIHGLSALAFTLSVGCLAIYSSYLANKLDIRSTTQI